MSHVQMECKQTSFKCILKKYPIYIIHLTIYHEIA